MKKLVGRFLFIILCVLSYSNSLIAKQADLLTVLFDDEEEFSHVAKEDSTHLYSIDANAWQTNQESNEVELDAQNILELDEKPHVDESASSSPCSLLDLLFADSQISTLFPDKHQKYYRGQFEVIGLKYIDNSLCDEKMPAGIRSTRAIDQDQLSPAEKEVVEKYYRLTKQQYESPWYMKFISKKVGYGIYAAADIEPGQLIAEYVGIIYDEQSYLSKPQNPKYCWNLQPPSFTQGSKKYYVDAIKYCNFTRIINHSYKPNVIPVAMHGPDGSRMLYVACERIKKDEQLLVNYGTGYWQSLGEPEELSR
jgi:hypothetical protein